MKVLITGHDGYIGSVLVPVLLEAGHALTGVDTFFYAAYPRPERNDIREIHKDIRDLTYVSFQGFDAVVHLASLSNDPLGDLNPQLTHAINHAASLQIARLAKEAGVSRFLFASTCSVYGVSSQEELATEESPLRPLSAYAESKVRVEDDLAKLADGSFSPVFLRNATAYGWSPRFRTDLVVNNLVCWALTAGEIRILSDGTPWRPVVHVQDIASAFAAALAAPREAVHNQAFNVGVNAQNYQVHQLAVIVQRAFPGCKLSYAEGGGPDPRSYRVDFSKIRRLLSAFRPVWDAPRGVAELRSALAGIPFSQHDLTGPKYVRLARLKSLLQSGELDGELRWRERVIQPAT